MQKKNIREQRQSSFIVLCYKRNTQTFATASEPRHVEYLSDTATDERLKVRELPRTVRTLRYPPAKITIKYL